MFFVLLITWLGFVTWAAATTWMVRSHERRLQKIERKEE